MRNTFLKSVFIERLRKLMKEKGYSVNKLHEVSGITRRNIDYYLDTSSSTIPKTDTLFDLAESLNVSVDYLIGRDDVRHFGNAEIIEATGLSETSIEVLRDFAKGGYSKANTQMINYILEKYHESGSDNKLTVLWDMYSYIHASDLVYYGNTLSTDEINFYKTHPDPDDNVTFYDKGRNAIFKLKEPEKLYQVSALEDIQQYLRNHADQYRKQTEANQRVIDKTLPGTTENIIKWVKSQNELNTSDKKPTSKKSHERGEEVKRHRMFHIDNK